MATAERTAVHTRKAMESVDQRVERLENEVAEMREQLNRMEGMLSEALKKQVVEGAEMPPPPTRASTVKPKAGAK